MNLNVSEWKEYKVSDLFYVKYGVNLELNACFECDRLEENSVNFVARIAENNGVSSRVAIIKDVIPQKPGLISVAGGGSVLSTFLQDEPFYSGRDLYVLDSKENISFEAKMFIITIIRKNKYKYSYGRQANKTLPDLLLKLPADDNGAPDYKFMEDYIKSINHKPITTKNGGCVSLTLGSTDWKEYKLRDIFNLKGGFYNKKPEHSDLPATIPFLASTESNNGVTEMYAKEDIYTWDKVGGNDYTYKNKIFEGNSIAVTVDGSVCNAYYQKNSFTCSHSITALYLKGYTLNSALALFLCTVIMAEKYRWSYGRKPHDVKKFSEQIIKLPTKDNHPDWEYMENYIKSLPYGDRI